MHLPMEASSGSYFAATVGLRIIDILDADAEEMVAAIREGRTRVIGMRTPSRFFIGNTVQSICLIVRKGGEVKKFSFSLIFLFF